MPASEPKINKSNDAMWFLFWNHDVPFPLWESYKRKRVRIKVYENLNRYKGHEREKYAEALLAKYRHLLENLKYNPFAEELALLQKIEKSEIKVEEKIKAEEIRISDGRKENTNIIVAMDQYLQSRIERTDNTNSISTHRGVVKWFTKYLTENNLLAITVSDVKRQHIADALLFTKKDRSWGPTTYNSHIDLIMTAFNWFEKEEYIVKNPATGKIEKVRAVVGKNTWYKKEVADRIKKHMVENKLDVIYNACAFTYHLCVRSQQELLKMKVSDFDFSLKRVRFRKEVSKNGKEAYRDFTPEFEAIAKSMGFQKLPGDYFIFGSGGKPGPAMAGKNSLSRLFKDIKDKLNLSDDYTVYGWKHTRVIHEMMKGTNAYDIQYLCRHGSLQETEKYMRGFDLSLRNIYDKDDLNF